MDSAMDILMETKGIEYSDIQETIKRLKEEKKKLKKQISAKENDVINLRKLLEESENKKKQYFISLKEARKITYKALRKGSATQNLINIIENNSINYKLKKKAINQLMLNAFGVVHHTKKVAMPDILKYTDSHLKLFRQEQLILLAENERLAQQMKELKKQIADNKIDFLKKNEKSFVISLRNTKDTDNTLSFDERQTDDNYVELDADLVENKLNILIKNIKMVQFKLLCYAFRKLTNYVCCRVDIDDINKKINKIHFKSGIKILKCVMENKIKEAMKIAFSRLLRINKMFTNFSNKRTTQSTAEYNLNSDIIRKPRGEGAHLSGRVYTNGKNSDNTFTTYVHDTNKSDIHNRGSHGNDARSKIFPRHSGFSIYSEFPRNSSQIQRHSKQSMPYFIHKPYYYDSLPSANVESHKTSPTRSTPSPKYITDYISNNQRNYYNDISAHEFENTFENLKKDIHHNINTFNMPFYGNNYEGPPKKLNVDAYESLDKLYHSLNKGNRNSSNHKASFVGHTDHSGLDRFDVLNDFNSRY